MGASSSEKETPTVVFASSFSTSYSPYAVVETNKSTMIAASAVEGPAPTSSTQQCRQSDEDDGSSSSPDEVLTQDLEYRKACAVIQNVLECGIASVCRLRKIFPPSFFERMDVDGTTVTSFRNDHIRNLCSSSIGKENASTNTIDYGGTSVNTASVRHSSLSPLTYDASQKSRVDGENKNVGSSYLHGSSTREKEQQTLAMEALLLLYWMKREGVGTILNEGKLARVVFGICVPPEDSMREKGDNDLPSDGELIESYSVSCYLFQFQCVFVLFANNASHYSSSYHACYCYKKCSSIFLATNPPTREASNKRKSNRHAVHSFAISTAILLEAPSVRLYLLSHNHLMHRIFHPWICPKNL